MPNLRENFLNLSIITTYDQIDPNDGKGSIVAMDPVTLKPRWKVQHDSFWNGGILATEGDLVFQGTADGEFAAYSAIDGKKLWFIDS